MRYRYRLLKLYLNSNRNTWFRALKVKLHKQSGEDVLPYKLLSLLYITESN